MTEKCWFVIQTRPKFEKKVERQILQRGIDVFLPLIVTIRKWSDRKKKVEVPMFSGYVFVNIEDEKRINAIQDVVGAMKFVYFNGRPAKVSEREIENIRISLKAPERFKIETSSIKKGDYVTITGGLFKGMEGTVTQYRNNYMLTVFIQELSISLSVVLNASEVKLSEKINDY